MTASFFITSVFLGIGLAIDAFSVSMANGLSEPHMSRRKTLAIAATFSGFQFLMPLIGWVCVHTVVEYFSVFQQFVPWIALGLLGYLGAKMLVEGIRENTVQNVTSRLSTSVLLMQGIATSIDALSVGFAIANYNATAALITSLVIMIETFIISLIGMHVGRLFGTKLAGKASIFGGIVLIGIGVEIFVSNLFF